MKIKNVRLAQAIPGVSSNLLGPREFDFRFDGAKLHVKFKAGDKAQKHGTFMIFPANIAYIEYEEVTEVETDSGQDAGETAPEGAKKGPGRPKK